MLPGVLESDLRSGHHQVRTREEEKPKTAFILHRFAVCEWNVMPPGAASPLSVFRSSPMHEVLGDLLGKTVYSNDMLVCSKSVAGHEKNLPEVLERLRR